VLAVGGAEPAATSRLSGGSTLMDVGPVGRRARESPQYGDANALAENRGTAQGRDRAPACVGPGVGAGSLMIGHERAFPRVSLPELVVTIGLRGQAKRGRAWTDRQGGRGGGTRPAYEAVGAAPRLYHAYVTGPLITDAGVRGAGPTGPPPRWCFPHLPVVSSSRAFSCPDCRRLGLTGAASTRWPARNKPLSVQSDRRR